MFNSCKETENRNKTGNLDNVESQQLSNPEYELDKPDKKPNAVVVLFGGYPEVAGDIKREFKILEQAREHDIAVVFSNYNQKLWFEENELKELAEQLQKLFADNKLPNDNIYFGGFSSGGNVALLIGDYLTENGKFELTPKGLFVIDSPVDLAALYLSAEKNIKRNFSEASVQEANFLIKTLGNRFGTPDKNLEKYEKHAVFTLQTGNIDNIKNLKDTKIRIYTEPDTLWWKENRKADYEQMNAYYLKKLSEKLKQQDFINVAYIPTKDRGYRANGERHPHSWAIVKTDDLINWMLNK